MKPISPPLKFIREYRIITILCLLFMGYLATIVSQWYMSLPDPNNSQGAFGSAVVLACVGVIKFWVESKADNRHQSSDSIDED